MRDEIELKVKRIFDTMPELNQYDSHDQWKEACKPLNAEKNKLNKQRKMIGYLLSK